MTDTLLDALKRTRPGYDEECRFHRFLVDAYTGCGGFEGSTVPQPMVSYWGPGAEVYAATGIYADALRGTLGKACYLDQYQREDAIKYEGRRRVANYLNYVEPLTDLKVSYLLRKPFDRPDEPEKVTAWRADMDGEGTSWDDTRPTVYINAAITGWTPFLLDRPQAPEGMSKAQAQAEGLDRFIARQLAPANLLEWSERDGRLLWAKVKTSRCEREAWDGSVVEIDEYSIWNDKTVLRYEVRSVDKGDPVVSAPVEVAHPFGRVPIAIFRHKRVPGRSSSVMGMPMHAQVSKIARRLFNLTSEFDEHVRSQVFAILVMCGVQAAQQGDVNIGVSNGLTLDQNAGHEHYYLAPPASVAETLEKRTIATITEIYRIGRVEFTRPAGGVTSAESRSYEFQQTNRAIADFAAEGARAETELAQLVGRASGVDEKKLNAYAAIAPTNFDVEDLARDLKAAADAITIGLGPTATMEIKARVVERMLPQASPAVRKKILAELDEASKQPPPAPPVPAPPPGVVPPKPPAPAPAPPA